MYVYLFIYFGRTTTTTTTTLSLRVFVYFSLFILSTLNKYHEKFQRSLTSDREISAKRKQIARN